MKKVWSFVKKWWWALLGGLLGLIVIVLRGMNAKKRVEEDGDARSSSESLLEIAKNEAHKAETEILVEKAKKKANTEAEKKVLENIQNEPDLKIRRRRMAQWATQNL